MAERFNSNTHPRQDNHTNQQLGRTEEVHTTPSRFYLEQIRNEGQPAAVPSITQLSCGPWTPNQATPDIGSVHQGPYYRAQLNYPAMPYPQREFLNLNSAANSSSANPQGGQQPLSPGWGETSVFQNTTSAPIRGAGRPPSQEEWEALSPSEKDRMREARDTQAAVLASIQDQIQIETRVRSYSTPMFQTGPYSNNPYRQNNIQSRPPHRQSGYGPLPANQPSLAPPPFLNSLCALCIRREAVIQYPSFFGGARICAPCYDDAYRAENQRFNAS